MLETLDFEVGPLDGFGVYSLSRLKTGLIITCYLGANIQKVSQIMGVSKGNIQNNGLKSKIGTRKKGASY